VVISHLMGGGGFQAAPAHGGRMSGKQKKPSIFSKGQVIYLGNLFDLFVGG